MLLRTGFIVTLFACVVVACSGSRGEVQGGAGIPDLGPDAVVDSPSEGDAKAELACTEGIPSGFTKRPSKRSLPAPRCGESFDSVAGAGQGNVDYVLLDVNADRRPDLVVTRDACDEAIGERRWDVYFAASDDSGFARTPTPFAVPAARCDVAFRQVSASYEELSYVLLDVNADRRPDLVVTNDRCDAQIGAKRWDVYFAASDDSGFAKTPSPFTVPAARCDVAFRQVSASYEQFRYALLDVNADRRPDLVVTGDGCDAQIGTKRWDVYFAASDDSGFAKTPSPFTVPAARCDVAFWQTSASYEELSYALLDVNADRRPDLVVTGDGCDAQIGAKRWDVYLAGSDDSGFATKPVAFTLPAARCETPFNATAASRTVAYALLDVSCDGRSDLVLTRDDCDEEVGSARWDVYVASDTGFAAKPSALSLPAARCSQKFDAMTKREPLLYSSLDMNADDRVDLLVTSDSCDATIGDARWDVYTLE